MEAKDYILISVSICALTISLISLVVTLIQKNKETKRTIRKNLTDTLDNIAKINIETTKLRTSHEHDTEQVILLRRLYNTQRRVLISHADFLIVRYDKLATEIDTNVLAGAYATIGDQERSEYFWRRTVDKSSSMPIKVMNLRAFGTFLFNHENVELGREMFNKAISIKLTLNDESKIIIIDTLLMLCDLELEFGSKVNYETSLKNAMEVWSTIVNPRKKEEMFKRMKSKKLTSDSVKPTA